MPATYPTSDDCIFCNIIAGRIPCALVYEDDAVIAFLDINPIAKGHTLIAPKGHYPTLLDVPADTGEPLLKALRLVGGAVYSHMGAGGFNIVQNNFGPAGQMVFHSHWHIIPRFEKDGLADWPSGAYRDTAEMQELARAVNALITG